jgi:hypothetical protein
MSESRQIRLARARAEVMADVKAIDAAIRSIASNGYASATISAAGGSKSYTKLDLGNLRALRADLVNRLSAINSQLAGRGVLAIRHLVTVRS